MFRRPSAMPSLNRSAAFSHLNRTPSAVPASSRGLPSYCPPQGQYFGYNTVPSSCPPQGQYFGYNTVPSRPASTASLSLQSSRSVVPQRGFNALSSCSRHPGTRLSRGYAATTMARPEIYEQAYGVSFLPGYGRDSYSAYKIADATIGDCEDFVSASNKRDNQILRQVEMTIANANIGAPIVKRTFVRASSVPPQSFSCPSIRSSKVVRGRSFHKPSAGAAARVRRSAANDIYYRVPPPKIQYHYETVNKGSDLLSAKERMFARELVDLTSPSATLSLKMRIHDAQNVLNKHGAMLNKYSAGPDTDDVEVDTELRRIRMNKQLRAKSVV